MKDTISNIAFLNSYIWKHKKSVYVYIIICGMVQALQISASIVGIRLILDFLVEGNIRHVIITIGAYAVLNLLPYLIYCVAYFTHMQTCIPTRLFQW